MDKPKQHTRRADILNFPHMSRKEEQLLQTVLNNTAEGVETQQQMEVLQAIGCTEMQSYLFSHARPAHEIRRFFVENPSRNA
jgi:predicted signal transduction protein with EAL and GGDEF domain